MEVQGGVDARGSGFSLRKTRIFCLLCPKQGPHEAAIVSENAAALVSNPISLNEFLVDAEAASISLVFRQIREAEERQCTVARSSL